MAESIEFNDQWTEWCNVYQYNMDLAVIILTIQVSVFSHIGLI